MFPQIQHRLAKLGRLTVAEARARLDERVRTVRERFRPPAPTTRADLQGSRQRLAELIPGAHAGEVCSIERLCPRLHTVISERVRSRVRQLEQGELLLLWRPVKVDWDIDWHRDPLDPDFRWPAERFYADIDYANPAYPDFKYIWELNRHQFFVDLAADWLLHGRGESTKRLRHYVLAWIDQNPVYYGINWTSALEVAVRATSWLWSLAITSEWTGWKQADLRRILASLVDHGRYLVDHLSLYSSPYNHLIGELTALYLLGQVFRGVPEARRWRARARHYLKLYAPRQFGDDGFTVEQATGYHFFTTGFLTLAYIAADRFGDGELVELLGPLLRRAYRAAAAFAGPDGYWPAIGDVDLARSIPVVDPDPAKFWDFRSLCNLGATLLNDPEVGFREVPVGEEAFWLLGADAERRFRAICACDGCAENSRPSPLRAVRLMGLPPVLRTEHPYGPTGERRDLRRVGYAHYTGRFLLDCAPIAGGLYNDDTSSSAHGHLDLLQVVVWLDGRPVVVDAGMASYRCDDPLFRYQRSEDGHNTLRLEGCSLAEYAGGLDWRRVIAPELLQLDVKFAEDVGVAVATIRWPQLGRVRRTVFSARADEVWVVDELLLRERRRVEWFWHPATPVQAFNAAPTATHVPNVDPGSSRRLDRGPDGRPAADEPSLHEPCLSASWEGATLRMWALGVGDLAVACEGLGPGRAHAPDPPAGWRSVGYGHREPGSRLRVSGVAARGHAVMVTCFARTEPAAALRVGPYEVNLGVRCPAVHRFGLHSAGELMTWFFPESEGYRVYAVGNIVSCHDEVREPDGMGELAVLTWHAPAAAEA